MKQAIPILEWFVEFIGGLARLCVLALVILVATNVILRYLFSIGPVSMQELEWHLISPIALFGLAYAMKHKADVRVDFVYDRFGPMGQGIIDLASAVLTLGVALFITYLSIPYVMQSYAILEGSPDPGGLPYRYLLKIFLPLGFGLLMVQALANLLAAVVQIKEAKATP
jgi:TRAP-type mannitol/chloroaromatic compound transport system permease small subunit